MAKLNRYKPLIDGKAITLDGEWKELEVDARTPAKGLRVACELAGLTLASQDGRYGILDDGRPIMAATCPWTRRKPGELAGPA
jgi:hypothetical protein